MARSRVAIVSMALVAAVAVARAGRGESDVPVKPGGSAFLPLFPAVRAAAAGSADASQGKNSAYASADLTIPRDEGQYACNEGVASPLLSVTIAKGKAKNVLVIDGMLLAHGPGDSTGSVGYLRDAAVLRIDALVNGFPVTPSNADLIEQTCGLTARPEIPGQYNRCSVTGFWFVDLDAAEAAQPGKFLKQPLTVDLYGCLQYTGGVLSGTTATGEAALAARLEKK